MQAPPTPYGSTMAASDREPPAAACSTVVLVDDDPAIRASLAFSLGLEGFAVQGFETGEALLDTGDLSGDGCLVLDYRLPGMDGLTLLAILRRRGVSMPAVVITSNPTRAIRQRTAEAGALLIEKPLLCDSLTAGIRSLIASRTTAA